MVNVVAFTFWTENETWASKPSSARPRKILRNISRANPVEPAAALLSSIATRIVDSDAGFKVGAMPATIRTISPWVEVAVLCPEARTTP